MTDTPDAALIEAIAEGLCSCSKIGNLTVEMSDLTAEDQEFTRGLARAAYAAMVEHLGLTEEDQWVPISESGARWAPRTRDEARRDLADWPAGVTYSDGSPADGITHIVHERRLRSEWEVQS